MAAPRTSALIPAAVTRGTTALTETEQELSSAAIDTFTKAVGGREALIDALSVADAAPEVDQVVSLLLDPKFQTWSLRRICQRAGITVADLFAVFKKATIARAHIQAAPIIAQKLVGVVADVMTRAQPYEIDCTACAGVGRVTAEPSPKNPNPSPQVCETCRGGGKLLAYPDLDRQKLALELGQLVTKGGGIALQVNQQQNVITERAGSTAPGALVQLQQAMDAVLFAQPVAQPPAVEAEIVEPEPPADDATPL